MIGRVLFLGEGPPLPKWVRPLGLNRQLLIVVCLVFAQRNLDLAIFGFCGMSHFRPPAVGLGNDVAISPRSMGRNQAFDHLAVDDYVHRADGTRHVANR